MLATAVPRGFGHNYAASNYIDGWIAVTQPPQWDAPALAKLRQTFRSRETL
jgi:uncharacterized membrane protein